MSTKEYLGIDIGASGMKGAIVNIETGELVSKRLRLPTPKESTPEAVAEVFVELVNQFDWKGKPIGVGFPSIVKDGVTHTAANIDDSWIGVNAEELFSKATNCPVGVKNDADVAGIAEMNFGEGRGKTGTVLIVTIGSGLGSALFVEGHLLSNTEFGHFYLKGQKQVVEKFAADSARKREDLSWQEWAHRFDEYLQHINKLLSPDLIILGGGASKKFERFSKYLTIDTPVVPAKLLNNAGIIGAAVHAYNMEKTSVEINA